MSAVTTVRRVALDRLRTAALATALACAASGAHASVASVVINGFTIGTNADPAVFVFGPTDLMNQVWDLSALDGGGVIAQQLVNGSVADWSNVNETAQTPMATATVSSSQATDPVTQLPTPLFTLAANATGANNTALGSMISSGSFCFGDGTGFDGTSAGCNAAGELTFTVYFDLIVGFAPGDVIGSLADAGLYLHITSGDGSLSTTLWDFTSTNLTGSVFGQSLTSVLALTAGDAAHFDLSGLVRANAVSVPEPNVLALVGLGLFGLAATRRRQGRLRSAA